LDLTGVGIFGGTLLLFISVIALLVEEAIDRSTRHVKNL
jgi:hypothetical protein